ncbi:hypothetical protein GC102_14360 [Paenibacillus sp. LMG 31460]|uniref:Uncharacterized protein n=1 Tax=Paenibacillus germinis TaxID=2654979 RepID=A0ABX1Z0M9_9BACL|nr:hypothetical protein [Paenibacillus germinis]NOU86953.1 hypothetical protein [Paenibacillus germinis]
MKTYLFRSRGKNNEYYPDREDKYVFNSSAPSCDVLRQDIESGGVSYYLYLIKKGIIVERGFISNYETKVEKGRVMYYAIYENRTTLNPFLVIPRWLGPMAGIIQLDDSNRRIIESLM